MLRRLELDEPVHDRSALNLSAAHDPATIEPSQLALDSDSELLPEGHPKWVRDGISISRRARDAMAMMRPIALRVMHFWDHRVRAVLVAGRRLRVDPTGSYRAE
jgi:hypothetical protein